MIAIDLWLVVIDLKILVTISSNDRTAANLYGITLLLYLIFIPLLVEHMLIIDNPNAILVWWLTNSSRSRGHKLYHLSIRCIDLAVAISGMRVRCDVLDHRVINVLHHVLLHRTHVKVRRVHTGARTIIVWEDVVYVLRLMLLLLLFRLVFLTALCWQVFLHFGVDILCGMWPVILLLNCDRYLPWYLNIIRVWVSLDFEFIDLMLFALFNEFSLLNVWYI